MLLSHHHHWNCLATFRSRWHPNISVGDFSYIFGHYLMVIFCTFGTKKKIFVSVMNCILWFVIIYYFNLICLCLGKVNFVKLRTEFCYTIRMKNIYTCWMKFCELKIHFTSQILRSSELFFIIRFHYLPLHWIMLINKIVILSSFPSDMRKLKHRFLNYSVDKGWIKNKLYEIFVINKEHNTYTLLFM